MSNLRKQASGHTYFTLKDQGAQISAVLFRGNAARLSKEPKEGDQIVVRGELSVYAPRGNYQIIVREIDFAGTGELLRRLHELKLELRERGWLDQEKKKPLPQIPKRIGVVTSPTGSVIQDILNVLSRRFSGFQLLLNPVRVQGAEAAGEIAKAIEEFNRYELADVLIVGRGGGSLEDLWPFNEEIVAKAIFDSKIPIISAVGHETDYTIADLVADVRAPTPSAAAEIVTVEKSEQLLQLQKAKNRLAQSLHAHLRTSKRMLEQLKKHPSISSPYLLLSPFIQKVDEIREDLGSTAELLISKKRLRLEAMIHKKEALRPGGQIARLKEGFARVEKDLDRVMRAKLARRNERLRNLSSHLNAIDPRNLLKKGYSILFREKNDSVILQSSDVAENEQVRIQLSDGKLLVQVKEKL